MTDRAGQNKLDALLKMSPELSDKLDEEELAFLINVCKGKKRTAYAAMSPSQKLLVSKLYERFYDILQQDEPPNYMNKLRNFISISKWRRQ